MLNKDSDGRFKLSNDEWCTLKAMTGAYNTLLLDKHVLEERLRKVKRGWCNFNLLLWLFDTLLAQLFGTVPRKKLGAIEAELKHTTFNAKMKNSVDVGGDYVVCDVESYVNLINMAVEDHCFICQKDCKQAKRCKLYKSIEGVIPFEITGTDDGKCIMAERLTIPLITKGGE